MTLLYADTSALIRVYFADEPDHAVLREQLLEGGDPVVTSELARIEMASAVRAAASGGRLRGWRGLLARMDADCGTVGPITLLALRPDPILPRAYRLVTNHQLRTLDAVHLAVAIEECPLLAGREDFALVTRDDDQASAARSLGVALR